MTSESLKGVVMLVLAVFCLFVYFGLKSCT